MNKQEARVALFKNANFKWLLGGGLISMLGDQFTLIALPWLVLKLTGDPLALGLVLAAMSVPRAIFMLVGGALVDRYSPKSVLMLTKYANTVLLALLAVLVLSHSLTLPVLYALAIAIGLASAFSYPAGSSITPQVLPPDYLVPANGILMGLRQIVVLLGPLLAGLLIVLFGQTDSPGGLSDATGLGIAFALDAFSYAISAWTLAHVKPLSGAHTKAAPGKVFAAIAEALRYFWNDRVLRSVCLYFAAVSFFVGGPIQVGLPVLADTQLPSGAAGFGMLLASNGIGSVLGMLLAGMKPKWRLGTLGLSILAVDATAGLLLLPLGGITAVWQGALLFLPVGLLSGFLNVAVYTWMQKRLPAAMLGRGMSVFMFIFTGLSPIAAAAAGALLQYLTPAQLFFGAGLCLISLALLALLLTSLRELRDWEPEAV